MYFVTTTLPAPIDYKLCSTLVQFLSTYSRSDLHTEDPVQERIVSDGQLVLISYASVMFFSLERKHSHYKEDGNSLRKISNFVHQEPMTPIDACTSETATLTSVLGIQASWLAAEPEAKPLFDYLLIIFLLFLFLLKEYKFFIIHCSVIIIFVTIIIIYFQISNVLLKWLSLSLHF